MLNRLRDRVTTDGPGYTDHPEKDIQAHRKNAQHVTVLGLFFLLLGVGNYIMAGQLAGLLFGLTMFFAALYSAEGLRRQALEWRLELERQPEDVDPLVSSSHASDWWKCPKCSAPTQVCRGKGLPTKRTCTDCEWSVTLPDPETTAQEATAT